MTAELAEAQEDALARSVDGIAARLGSESGAAEAGRVHSSVSQHVDGWLRECAHSGA